MTKTAADVEREVEASRSDLDRTVEALKDKMTPGQLFDEASRAMGSAGQQVMSKFVEQAKQNPMPLAVMGLGLAWLMSTSGKKESSPGPGYAEPRSFAAEGSWEGGGGLGAKLGAARDKAPGLVEGAKDRLSDAASGLGDTASSAAEKVSRYGQQAQQSFAELLEAEPLWIGAAGLFVGAAIGASLPHTQLEDHAIGPVRDKLLEKGKDIAQDGAQQAGDMAKAAYVTVKDELTKGTPEGADPADRATEIARNAIQAGRDELSSPH